GMAPWHPWSMPGRVVTASRSTDRWLLDDPLGGSHELADHFAVVLDGDGIPGSGLPDQAAGDPDRVVEALGLVEAVLGGCANDVVGTASHDTCSPIAVNIGAR